MVTAGVVHCHAHQVVRTGVCAPPPLSLRLWKKEDGVLPIRLCLSFMCVIEFEAALPGPGTPSRGDPPWWVLRLPTCQSSPFLRADKILHRVARRGWALDQPGGAITRLQQKRETAHQGVASSQGFILVQENDWHRNTLHFSLGSCASRNAEHALWDLCGAVWFEAWVRGVHVQVVRARLQQRQETGRAVRYTSGWLALQVILRREGVGGLYKGLLPNVLRVMPQSALTFLVYEKVLDLLNHEAFSVVEPPRWASFLRQED